MLWVLTVQPGNVWITSKTRMVLERTQSLPIDPCALSASEDTDFGPRRETQSPPPHTHFSTPHLKHTIVSWMTLLRSATLTDSTSIVVDLPPSAHIVFHFAEFELLSAVSSAFVVSNPEETTGFFWPIRLWGAMSRLWRIYKHKCAVLPRKS